MKYCDECENPVVMRSDLYISGADFICYHEYTNGHVVPIYLIDNYYALSKLLGYSKYINGEYGTILYRGECSLHNTMLPSIHRGLNSNRAISNANYKYNKLSKNVLVNKKFLKTIMTENQCCQELVLEGLLQHYGIKTHFIDVVDNHWVALWFGLYEPIHFKSINSYVGYKKRSIDNLKRDVNIYQFMVLIASNNNLTSLSKLKKEDKTVTLDLRANLPTTFLRPHAQHGLVIRKIKNDNKDGYDLANYVVGIIKIPVKCVDKWLGNGTLLTVNNLFPSPAYDIGYDLLLQRSDLFGDKICKITY